MVMSARTDDEARTRTLKERGRTLKRRACALPCLPCMLSWQQMASFNVQREELHDLTQQCGTRETRLLGDWAHLCRR